MPAKVQRRRFTAHYRLRIVKQADACKKPGELGPLLRGEGLYSSHLTNWRREEGAFASRRARKRGPTPQPNRFARETARSRERPAPAEVAAGRHDHHAPKKVAEVLGIPPKERPPAQPPEPHFGAGAVLGGVGYTV